MTAPAVIAGSHDSRKDTKKQQIHVFIALYSKSQAVIVNDKTMLADLINRYSLSDIYNADKTGLLKQLFLDNYDYIFNK